MPFDFFKKLKEVRSGVRNSYRKMNTVTKNAFDRVKCRLTKKHKVLPDPEWFIKGES